MWPPHARSSAFVFLCAREHFFECELGRMYLCVCTLIVSSLFLVLSYCDSFACLRDRDARL